MTRILCLQASNLYDCMSDVVLFVLYCTTQAVALGIPGDQTQHLQWRVLNGELPDVLDPYVIVLHIGVNDLNSWTPALDVACQIEGLVRMLRALRPRTAILLNAILPNHANRTGTAPPPPPSVGRRRLLQSVTPYVYAPPSGQGAVYQPWPDMAQVTNFLLDLHPGSTNVTASGADPMVQMVDCSSYFYDTNGNIVNAYYGQTNDSYGTPVDYL